MDTKLKKFNLSALFKFIALLLCLLSVGVSVCYGATEFVMIKRNDLQGEHFYDAIYNTNNKNVAMTRAFKREANLYMNKVAELVANYGNGSKAAYEKLAKSCEKKNRETVKTAKQSLVRLLSVSNGFDEYLYALSTGVIVNCGFVASEPDVTDDSEYYLHEITEDTLIVYSELAQGIPTESDAFSEVTKNEKVTRLQKKNKADGVVFIPGAVHIIDYDEVNNERTVATYEAGYYLFRINEDSFNSHLVKSDVFSGTYGSYDEFRKSFDTLKADINESYPSGRYFIRDVKGNTYTNISSLGSTSSQKDIEKQFSSLGFYCKGGNDYFMILPDGKEYGASFIGALEGAIFDEGSVNYYKDYYPVMETTTLPTVEHTTTTMPDEQVTTPPEPTTSKGTYEVTKVTAIIEGTDDFTQVAVTAPVMAQNNYNGKSPFVIATEKATDMTVYFGVDFEDKAYEKQDCRFGKVQRDVYVAYNVAQALIIVFGTMGLLFLVCFVFLVLRSGKRFGDKENIYMLPFDNMFTDFRILLDCGIIFLLGLVGIYLYDAFYSGQEVTANEMIILLTGAIASAIMLFVLDIILFITRNVRRKTFAKRLFLVWCFSRLSEKSGKALKVKNKLLALLIILLAPANFLLYVLICDFSHNEFQMLLYLLMMLTYDSLTVILFIKEKNWLEPIKNKMQYVRGFEKEATIKGGIVLGINLIGIISGSIEMVRNRSIVIAIILAVFDLFVLIQLIRFIGGVKEIFSAVDEIKNGNYDVHINLYALPHSLYEPANKLMSLRDGLKRAIDEAVKQEQTKTELITNVSHDLKTPLTSIINYVDLLKKCDITDETAREYLGVLGEKSDRLKKLIEDLVEASKASTGNIKLNMVDVSLNEILNQITGEFSDAFEKRGLTLISDIPEESFTVTTDSKSLYRILENLMGNAAKYAMENTRVYLSLSDRFGKNVISLKNISASPLNITAEQLKARFVRGDEARSSDGSGLGLSIAESLCTVLGGKLEIEINGDLFVATVVI